MLLGSGKKYPATLCLSGRWDRSCLSATPRERLPPVAGRGMLFAAPSRHLNMDGYASITAVEPSLDYVRLRRFSPCCHRMRSAILSHSLLCKYQGRFPWFLMFFGYFLFIAKIRRCCTHPDVQSCCWIQKGWRKLADRHLTATYVRDAPP